MLPQDCFQVFTYLQILELGGSTEKTLWQLCQLVEVEIPVNWETKQECEAMQRADWQVQAEQYQNWNSGTNYTATGLFSSIHIYIYLQSLELCGRTKKTLWQLCQLVEKEDPGELRDQTEVWGCALHLLTKTRLTGIGRTVSLPAKLC